MHTRHGAQVAPAVVAVAVAVAAAVVHKRSQWCRAVFESGVQVSREGEAFADCLLCQGKKECTRRDDGGRRYRR